VVVMLARPGVVVVAVEPEKAAVVLEALDLINVLIISRQLADTLARFFGVSPSLGRPNSRPVRRTRKRAMKCRRQVGSTRQSRAR